MASDSSGSATARAKRSLLFDDLASDSRSPSPSIDRPVTPTRPLTRRRGWSVPESQATSSSGFLSSYLPAGYALPSLQALDLGLPNMPAHLTYSSLRNSLLVHVEELERRLASYYKAVGSGPTTAELKDFPMHGTGDGVSGKDNEGAERDNVEKDNPAESSDAPDTDCCQPLTLASTAQTHQRSTSSSSSLHNLNPDHLLSLISKLREDISFHLPHLPSMANLQTRLPDSTSLPQLPPVREPLENFLASLPSRLNQVHNSLPSMPRSSSFKGLPDLSLHPSSPLGMGSQQILAMLDSILPDISDKQVDEVDASGLGGFPVFPNRTPRRHPAFERVLSTERRAKPRREGGQGDESSDEEFVLKVVEKKGPTVEDALAKAKGVIGGLIEYDDLPTLWQNNEYIVTGYRFIPIQDWPDLLGSLFRLHNETVNIHSHLLSAILVLLSIPFFIYASPFVPVSHQAPPSAMDAAILCSFLLAAFKCLFCSSLWHLFAGCATKKYFITFACVDYLGIAWLIAASVNAFVYFAFYCQPTALLFYTALNLGVAIAGSTLPFMSWFNERQNKGWRIAFFLSMAGSAVGPLAQLSLQKGLFAALRFTKPLAPMMLSYIFGLTFYAEHFPERRWPGLFDRFGASHQIWHFSIVAAILFNFFAILELFKTKDTCLVASEPALWQEWTSLLVVVWRQVIGSL